MALVPYRNNNQLMNKKKKNKKLPFSLNPNQLAYDLGFGAVDGAGKLAMKAVRGIVSAFQNRGASRNEITALVAPLAKSLTYTSRKPKFTKAEGGLAIEHIENLPLVHDGHTAFTIDTNLFIWLRNIASQFEEYQIQLWFAWNPICPATTTGQVLLAFDYDPADENVGEYIQPADYFNTADHCVSAIWAPAALAPQKSAWLKTGNTGDVRLYSPGKLHLTTTGLTSGYLTVKYQVSLRKPQPQNAETDASFSGTYTTATGIFANDGAFGGNIALISSIVDDKLTLTATPGNKIVVWSTDGTSATIVPTLTNATLLGVKVGAQCSFVVHVKAGFAGEIGATVVAPGGPTSYKVVIYQESAYPTYA